MDPANLANEISKHSNDPNYLPLALLVLCIAGGAWLFKWLVGRLQEQTSLLAGLFKEANEGRTETARIIGENSEVIRENTTFIRTIKTR